MAVEQETEERAGAIKSGVKENIQENIETLRPENVRMLLDHFFLKLKTAY